jgi:maltoporin
MYRGDDIYLLNLWPLDNQNTIGAGAFYTLPSDTIVAGHVGMNRMDNPNQFQTIPQVSPLGFGATTALVLDRPRLIETLKVTQFFRNSEKKRYWSQDGAGLKAIVYGEAHQISGGVRRDFEPERQTALPSDFGFLVGGQLTYWTGKRDTFASLFVRFAQGLAAYDPLDVPTTFAFDRRTQGATEFRVALSGNWERSFFGVTWGALIRNFRDASPQATSVQKYDEGAVVVRPHFFIGENFGISIDGSYQERRYAANPMTGEPLSANMLRGALLPYWSPTGRGAFKRPQIGPMYSIASRSSGARSLYGADDPFAQRSVEHFFGVLAEWWFNFSSYP